MADEKVLTKEEVIKAKRIKRLKGNIARLSAKLGNPEIYDFSLKGYVHADDRDGLQDVRDAVVRYEAELAALV